MCRTDLTPSPACSSFNSEQDRGCYCIPLQYLAYVVLLSRAASPSLSVIAITVKIQIGRMTMFDLGDGEEVVWGRFGEQWTTNSDSAPQEIPLNICWLAIGHREFNRGQWPQVTFVDFETHMMHGQGSQVVMYWHQSHQLSPFKSIAPRQVAFTLKYCRRLFLLWRHNFLTWPDHFFNQKLRKICPIRYGKFQHDTPNGVASSSEKLMGVASLPPPPSTGEWRR